MDEHEDDERLAALAQRADRGEIPGSSELSVG